MKRYIPNYDLYDIIDGEFLKRFKNLNCIKIGVIQAFDSEKQTVDVSVCDISVLLSGTQETDKLYEYPLLREVPCHFFRFGEGAIYAPPQQGDFCILLFCDHSLDGWWTSGKGAPDYTENNHDIKDAVAIVGLSNNVNPIQNFIMGLVLMWNANNSIIIKDGEITIKSPEITNDGNVTTTGNETINGDATIIGKVKITGDTLVTGTLGTEMGASGSFATADNKTVTVVKGIITAIG